MAFYVTDTTQEILSGSISLPKSGVVPIGAPVIGVSIQALKEELTAFYGDRFEVVSTQKPAETAPKSPRSTAKKEPEA
jgi:hypothetical protein